MSGNLLGVNLPLTEPPYITQQPQAPAGNRAAAGGTASFSVTALGTPALSYQWYRDAVALVNDARISGATSANLQLTGLVAGDAGGYACVIANAQGSVASKAPQLYVITNPQSISGTFIYSGTQTGQVHTTVSQLRNNNKVLNLSNTATNFAATTLTDLSGAELSIEYWFKGSYLGSAVRQQGGPGYIVAGWGGGLDILSNDGGTSGLLVSHPATLATDGNWHHVAMTWKQNTVNGFASYFDGELVEQRNSADAPVPNIGAQVFFGAFGGVYEFAHGMMDEIAIWGKALTRSEIRSHARGGLTGSEAGLKGYWNFDDGLGHDLTPNGNNAELFGGATIDNTSIPGQGAVYPDSFTGIGPYTITSIPAGNNYSLLAFLDGNGNGAQEDLEPRGAYAGNAFNLSASLSGADITFYEPPSAPTNLVSVTVLEGAAVRLNAAFGGTSNTFQWRYYSTLLVNGGRVSGAQSNYLTITGALLSDAGAYSLVASNPVGVASLTAAVIVQPPNLTNQLIAYWKFDETTGTTAGEATGLSQPGSLVNFPGDNTQWVPGQIGRALSFSDPTNQNYVIAPDYAKPTNTITLSAWVWAESRPNWASIAKNWGDTQTGQFHFGLNNTSGNLQNQMTDGGGNVVTAADAVPLPLGAWQQVAFVADGARMHLYRNGVEVAGSAIYNGTLLTPPMAGLGIGVKTDDSGTAAAGGAPGYWNGKLDDLGIWGRALSPDEIFGIYQGGLAGKGITQAFAVLPVTL
ncbi:MAG: LamG-like jellyroll fold domain-containing protein, partial [Phycisphaerae bacterium]